MSIYRIHRFLLVAFITTIAATTFAEELPAIVVTGHASQPQKPQILRMTMTLAGSGKDIRAAVAALKKVRDDLRTKLAGTGADTAAIKFSDTVEGTGGGPLSFQQRVMQQALAAQQKSAPAAANPPTAVSSNVTVEWPLPQADGDDALIAGNELIAKIKAVLPKAEGAAAPAAKTPEEQEVAEEMAGQQNGAETKPFVPTFLYVHKLTDAERSAAYTAAIADAKAQAGRLATAAGATLGPITRISTGSENQAENAMMAMMADNSGETTSATDESEAVSTQRSTVAFTTTLITTFALQTNHAAAPQENLGTK